MKKTMPLVFLLLLSSCTPPEERFQVGQIQSRLGEILIWLYQATPVHRQNFIDLAQAGYWDDYSFNRVIEDFVAQGGCPDTEEGFAYSIHLLEPEFRPNLRHAYGTFAAGRDNNPGKLSAGCQFYIVHDADGIPRLDDNYTIYGHVFEGMDVVDAIVREDTDDSDEPLTIIELDVNIIEMSRADIEASGFTIPVEE
jgi:peptidyl-prolyl cis-trans isomerase B (cyclophilin B)